MTVSIYIIGAIVSAVVLLVSVLVANNIQYLPDSSDVKKRKTWFWIISVLAPILTFAVSYFAIYQGIKIPVQKMDCMTAMCISAGVSWVLYIVLGVIVSKAFRNKKVGNWF